MFQVLPAEGWKHKFIPRQRVGAILPEETFHQVLLFVHVARVDGSPCRSHDVVNLSGVGREGAGGLALRSLSQTHKGGQWSASRRR